MHKITPNPSQGNFVNNPEVHLFARPELAVDN